MDKEITILRDEIYSQQLGKVLATIDIEKDTILTYSYIGKIIHQDFPNELLALMDLYVNTANEGTFSVLDDIYTQIHAFGLELKENKYKIFEPYISPLRPHEISFLIKFPTSQGYIDDYPMK